MMSIHPIDNLLLFQDVGHGISDVVDVSPKFSFCPGAPDGSKLVSMRDELKSRVIFVN